MKEIEERAKKEAQLRMRQMNSEPLTLVEFHIPNTIYPLACFIEFGWAVAIQ